MDWCYPNANYFRNCFATHWLPDVIITDNRWCGLNCTKNKKWLPCDFFIRSKSYTFLQPLGCYKKTEHTIQFLFGHFVSFQEQYMMTSDSMIIQTSTFWKIDMVIHKPKDYSVLIIVYLLHLFLSLGLWNEKWWLHNSSSSKMKLSRMWQIIYQSKGNYVLIIFLLKDLGDCLVLLG